MTAAPEDGRRADIASELVLRPMAPADVGACAEVFYAAQDELYTRNALPLLPHDAVGLGRFLERLLETDAERAWLAERRPGGAEPAHVVAFGCAVQRAWFHFLSFLFVHPTEQAAGLGRRVLLRCLPELRELSGRRSETPDVFATCVDSIQPISTALYAGYGLVPRVPLYTLLGEALPGSLPALPDTVRAQPFETLAADGRGHGALVDAVGLIDEQTVGFSRPADHRLWRIAGREGVLYTAAGSGDLLGYGYVQPSGRVGPVAVLDPTLLASVLSDLMTRLTPLGAWQLHVPGEASEALVPLLAAGFRVDGQPGIFCSTRRVVALDRYLPASFALV